MFLCGLPFKSCTIYVDSASKWLIFTKSISTSALNALSKTEEELSNHFSLNSKSLSFLVGQDWCKAYCPDSPKDSWHSIKYCSQISYQWIEQIFKHTLSCVGYWKRLESWANIFSFGFFEKANRNKRYVHSDILQLIILFMEYLYHFWSRDIELNQT